MTDRTDIRALLLPTLKTSDLGTANGWSEIPPIVENCERAKHVTSERTIGRCLREVSCPICNYKFEVDSGG